MGWQLDPFGHSAVNALLFAQMGMEAIFFARINEQDHYIRSQSGNMEFIWNPTFNSTFGSNELEESGDPNTEIFAHALMTHYTPMKGDWLSNKFYRFGSDTPTRKFADKEAYRWFELFNEKLRAYKTNNILILWGDDFAH